MSAAYHGRCLSLYMRNFFNLNHWLPFGIVTLICICLSSCQTTQKKTPVNNPFSVQFTGWPKKSVERLLNQFMESKSFLITQNREGFLRFDKKSSQWDHFKYGSFLEPNAWLRLEPTIVEEKDSLQTKLTIKVSIITHRSRSLEEIRKPKRRHLQEAKELIRAFEMMMLQPVGFEPDSVPESKSVIQ